MTDKSSILYRTQLRWYTMLKRAGMKGIEVCEEWRNSREAFVNWSLSNGFSPELDLDRKENDLGYSPENCQYITRLENTSKEKRQFDYEGKLYTMKELHKYLKSEVSYQTVKSRHWSGWPIIEAMTLPASHGNSWSRGSRV